MPINLILGSLIFALSAFFLVLQFIGEEIQAAGVRALAIILLTLLYIVKIKSKNRLFFLFLITFSIAEIWNYVTWVVNFNVYTEFDYFYYIGNGLYILAYIFLISRICMSLNIKAAFVKLPFQIILLAVMGFLFVYYITDTSKTEFNLYEYYLELTYNAIVMLLMALALINYMYRDDKKSMNLLIGTVCIMFSEVIQIAYFYIADFNLLNLL